jgi:hypothetical protein
MKKLALYIVVVGLIFGVTGVAHALSLDVYAYENSLVLNPLDTGIDLFAGDLLTINVALDDLWSAGAGPRISNADGLYNFPEYTYDGFSFRYGSLVGRIGAGDYFFVGTSYNATVAETGSLFLMYWDSNYYDNFEYITAAITAEIGVNAIPEPGSSLLLGSGLLGLLIMKRKYRK